MLYDQILSLPKLLLLQRRCLRGKFRHLVVVFGILLTGIAYVVSTPVFAEPVSGDFAPVASVSAVPANNLPSELQVEGNVENHSGFEFFDWCVLALYGIGMMAVGWYYSRASSVDEYLLGKRHMKPWAVGISLFSTLMSTLTYLSYPGEMVRHGPLILTGMLSYP